MEIDADLMEIGVISILFPWNSDHWNIFTREKYWEKFNFSNRKS